MFANFTSRLGETAAEPIAYDFQGFRMQSVPRILQYANAERHSLTWPVVVICFIFDEITSAH